MFFERSAMLKKLFVTCLLLLTVACPARAASVRQLLLDEIIDTSAIAFQGTCTSNRTERDALTNFIVTYTTFDVKDVLKGSVLTTHTIKQIGGKMPGGEAGFRVDGIPSFTVGEDYVVFLAGVSTAGFSSPIGLAQGKFTVRQNAAGKTVSNGSDFSEMTARMPKKVEAGVGAKTHQLDLDEFKLMARTHAGNLQ